MHSCKSRALRDTFVQHDIIGHRFERNCDSTLTL